MPTLNATSTRVQIAAFDFDGTLTRRDTLLPFLLQSLGWLGLARALLRSSPWLLAFALRLISNERAKARLLKVGLGGKDRAEMQAHAQSFARDYLPSQWQAWTLTQLAQHQAQGHLCVIVSASPGVFVHAAAASLGVAHVVCTELECLGERYSGRLATPNCYGQQKVLRLQAWLVQQGGAPGPVVQTVLHAYGDSRGDHALLNLAQHPWYRGRPWSEYAP